MAERFSPFDGYRAAGSLVPAGYISGKLRVLAGEYDAINLPAGESVMLGWLPEGGLVLDARIWTQGLGAGVTVALGDDGDDDRYITASAVSGAGRIEMNAVDGFLYRAPKRHCVKLKSAGAAASGPIKVMLIYALE